MSTEEYGHARFDVPLLVPLFVFLSISLLSVVCVVVRIRPGREMGLAESQLL